MRDLLSREAMRAALPVVAYDGGAVGETLGGSGVLLTTLDPVIIAEVVARVSGDDALSRQLRASGSRRAVELDCFDREPKSFAFPTRSGEKERDFVGLQFQIISRFFSQC